MVSIIIPTTRGGLGYLTRLMPTLPKDGVEVIVIDNASRDGTSNFLSQNYNLKIVVNNPGKNFAESNNQAARIAQGGVLMFLNNDTRLTPGVVENMSSHMVDKVAVVGCCLYTMTNPKKVQHAGVFFNDDGVPYELGLEIPDISQELHLGDDRVGFVGSVPSVTAACMMVRKDVFDGVGGFDEEYVNGWEDTDLVLKIRESGYEVVYDGSSKVYHHHFGSKNAGRLVRESENRARYDSIWVNTGRALSVLKKDGFK